MNKEDELSVLQVMVQHLLDTNPRFVSGLVKYLTNTGQIEKIILETFKMLREEAENE